MSNDVSVVDLKSRKVIATVKVGARPYVIAFAHKRAFVTNQGNATVSVIELEQNKLIKTIKVGDYPEGLAADETGRYLYVSCWSDNILVRLDAETLSVSGQVEVGNGPRSFGLFLR